MSDVVKNDVVKKAVYDKLVVKVNKIDTSVWYRERVLVYDTEKVRERERQRERDRDRDTERETERETERDR